MPRWLARGAPIVVVAIAISCNNYGADDEPVVKPAPRPVDAGNSELVVRDAATLPGPEDASAEAAAPPPCNRALPFGKPEVVGGLALDGSTSTLLLSADELTAFFSHNGGATNEKIRIWTARRSRREDPFAEARVLTTVEDPAHDNYANAVTPDGLFLFISRSDLFTPLGWFQTERSSLGVEFGPPQPAPFDKDKDAAMSINPNGAAFYYVHNEGGPQLLRRPLSGHTLGAPVQVALPLPGTAIGTAVFTADEKTLYVTATSTDLLGLDIWVATRSADTAAFGTPTRVDEVNSTTADIPSWVSPDGCRLYLSSARDGQSRVYVASKPAN